MNRRNDFVLYVVSAILLAGAASIWWQGIRPSGLTPIAASAQAPEYGVTGGTATQVEGTGGPGLAGGAAGADRPPEPAVLFVHVAGAVKAPGVYRLIEGQRLYEAVALAGPEDDADLDALNLAIVLRDSQKVYVPRKGETAPPEMSQAAGLAPPAGEDGTGAVFPININSAGAQELDKLPGVGPVLAAAIIARRTQFGPFERPEDLKNVPGIGEKTYAKIAPFVTVK